MGPPNLRALGAAELIGDCVVGHSNMVEAMAEQLLPAEYLLSILAEDVSPLEVASPPSAEEEGGGGRDNDRAVCVCVCVSMRPGGRDNDRCRRSLEGSRSRAGTSLPLVPSPPRPPRPP